MARRPTASTTGQYRVFVSVKVPHIAENVIYGEVHTGGKNGPIIKGQQVLYIISIDETHQAVNVSGRRIKDGADYEQVWLHPEKLKTIALDSNYGGNCDFRFRRYGRELRGWLANVGQGGTTCTMVSKTSGQTMTWDADWAITPDEIWVFDNGYLKDPAHPERQAGCSQDGRILCPSVCTRGAATVARCAARRAWRSRRRCCTIAAANSTWPPLACPARRSACCGCRSPQRRRCTLPTS